MDAGSRPFTPEELLAETEWVHQVARSLVGDRTAAEDVVQETWLAALVRRPRAGRSLRPWLARVLRNQAALLVRRERRAARDRTRTEASDEPLPAVDDLVLRAETQRLLVGAVLALEEPYRSVVLLRYYRGLSAAEIARRHGIPGATVRTRLRRALARLREELDREHEGERSAWLTALAPLAASARTARESVPLGLGLALPAALVVVAVFGWLAARLAPGGGGAALAPVAAAGRASSPALVEAAPPGRSPIAPAVETAPALYWRATLVDERTGEPLPHFAVELVGADGSSRPLRSDARGRLELERALAPGRHRLRLIDDPRLRSQDVVVHGEDHVQAFVPSVDVEVAAEGEALVPVPAGPTYRLRLEPSDGAALAELTAHLRSPGHFRTDAWDLHLAPLRRFDGDDGPWVRFGQLYTKFLDDRPPWELAVRSRDGRWAGTVEVQSIEGVHPGVLSLVLDACGTVAGTVRDELGPVANAELVLRAADAVRDRRDSPRPDGTFAFEAVGEGSWILTCESPRHLPASATIDVRPGRPTAHDFALERRPAGGLVRGTLASQSGTWRGPVVVALVPGSGPAARHERLFTTASWEEGAGGAVEGRFAFDDVPAGSYELRILSCADQLPWLPARARVEPPAELRLECADVGPRADLGFRVVDARDGRELDEVMVLYELGGCEVRLRRSEPDHAPDDPRAGEELWALGAEGMTWTHVPGRFPIRGFPVERSLAWTVVVPGYRPVHGDESAFLPHGADAGRRMAEVALEPGWGLRLAAVDARDEPLQGVEVSADARPAGRTGADGTLRLELAERPRRLTFEHPTHRLVGADLDPLDPPAFGRRATYELRMSRR